jgi:hypothetical protein
MADSIEQFSYELTANALAEQERAVGALRARAGTVLAAASIAGSFLGTKASHGSLDGWAVAALLTFALCLASAVWVLFPRSFVFAVRGEMLLTQTDLLGLEDVAEAYPGCHHLDRAASRPQPIQAGEDFGVVQRRLHSARGRSRTLDSEPHELT